MRVISRVRFNGKISNFFAAFGCGIPTIESVSVFIGRRLRRGRGGSRRRAVFDGLSRACLVSVAVHEFDFVSVLRRRETTVIRRVTLYGKVFYLFAAFRCGIPTCKRISVFRSRNLRRRFGHSRRGIVIDILGLPDLFAVKHKLNVVLVHYRSIYRVVGNVARNLKVGYRVAVCRQSPARKSIGILCVCRFGRVGGFGRLRVVIYFGG